MKRLSNIILCVLCISLGLISQKNYAQTLSQKKFIDSLYNELPNKLDLDSVSIKNVYHCYSLARKYNYYDKLLLTLNNITSYYVDKSDTLIKYIDDFYDCYEHIGSSYEYGKNLFSICYNYSITSDLVLANNYLIKLFDFSNKTKDENIDILYYLSKYMYEEGSYNYESAKKSLQKAYSLINDQTKVEIKENIYLNLMVLYSSEDVANYKEAVEIAHKYEDILNETYHITVDSLNNPAIKYYLDIYNSYISYYLIEKKDIQKAEYYYNIQKNIFNHIDKVENTLLFNYYFSSYQYYKEKGNIAKNEYEKSKNYNKALSINSKLLNIAIKYAPQYYIGQASLRVKLLLSLKRYDEAFSSYKTIINVQDSINSTIVLEEYNALKSLYNIDEVIKDNNSVNIRLIINIIIVLIILLIILALYIVYIFKNKEIIENISREKEVYNSNILGEVKSKEILQREISEAINKPLEMLVTTVEKSISATHLSVEKKEKNKEIIKFNADLLLDYVNDILMFSRLESDKLTYKIENVDIIPIIKEIVDKANSMHDNYTSVTFDTHMSQSKNNIDVIMFRKMLERILIYNNDRNKVYPISVKIEYSRHKGKIEIIIKGSPLSEISHDVYINVKNELNMHYQDSTNGKYSMIPNSNPGESLIILT